MNQNSATPFLTKMYMTLGAMECVLLGAVVIVLFQRYRGSTLTIGPLDVLVSCGLVFTPLLVGIEGFFRTKKLLRSANETQKKALTRVASLFSVGIAAAYMPLLGFILVWQKLHR